MNINRTREYDSQLYMSIYQSCKKGRYNELWEKIKLEQDKEGLLRDAIRKTKNKWGESTVVGVTICDCILKDYEDIEKDIYQELINLIYSEPSIARIVVGSVGGIFRFQNSSFLVQTLCNHELVLNEEQKEFAVSEAMNTYGTTLAEKENIPNNFIQKRCFQNHGTGEYDIRYQILMNPNWTIEEKSNLIYEFYKDDDLWDETLDQWKLGIVNDCANYKGSPSSCLNISDLYNYKYEELSKIYQDKATTDDIWEEILLCELFHQMRPQQWELNNEKSRLIKKCF